MKKSIIPTLLWLWVSVWIGSCSNFEYIPYGADIDGPHDLHAKNIADIERICQGCDTIRFAFITDSQGAYDEMKAAMDVIDRAGNVQFIVHGGDQSDFGITKEFLWTRNIFLSHPLPFVCLLGNHDCLGTGEHTFQYLYGDENFSFNASFLHFVGLNTVALAYDYSRPVPDLKFIERDCEQALALPDSLTFTIVAMHAPPHDEQFNDNVDNVFEYYITKYPGLRSTDPSYPDDDTVDEAKRGTRRNGFCLNGHTHQVDIKNIFNDGVLYYGLANTKKRMVQIYTVTRNGYDCQTISF